MNGCLMLAPLLSLFLAKRIVEFLLSLTKEGRYVMVTRGTEFYCQGHLREEDDGFSSETTTNKPAINVP